MFNGCQCSWAVPQENTERGKENQRNHVFVLWGAVQIACGSGLDHPWEWGPCLVGFLGGGVWTEATLRGGGLDPPTKHYRLLVYMDARGLRDASNQALGSSMVIRDRGPRATSVFSCQTQKI